MPFSTAAHPPHPNGRTPVDAPHPQIVGVFDSGVGGLSVLPALRRSLPAARLVYVADSGNAPYGERDDAWLVNRCHLIARFLRTRGAHMMVMACNTATAAAAHSLRSHYPHWPIVGIEPGIKPAVQHSALGRVGVMATSATLRSTRFERLLAEHGQGAQVVAQACTGLAMAIEQGDEPQIERLVMQHTQAMRDAGVDSVVMGCTHYPFARPWIERAMGPGVNLVDTADAVARRAAQVALPMSTDGHLAPDESPDEPADDAARNPAPCEFWTSGDPAALEAFARRWLAWTVTAEPLPDLQAQQPGC